MNLLKHLIIVGRCREDRDNMTSTLISECKRTGICHSRFDDTPFHDGPDDEGTMVAFCSSAGRFPNVLRECEDRGLPVTVVTSAIEMPKDPKTAVINVPNLGAVTNALFSVWPQLTANLKSLGLDACVAEFHQDTKKPGSATAFALAEPLGVPKERVASGRSNVLARVFLDVPERHHEGFARIGMVIESRGQKVKIFLETDGREAYFKGLCALAEKYFEREQEFAAGVFDPVQILFPPDRETQELIATNQALTAEVGKFRAELEEALASNHRFSKTLGGYETH